MSAKITFGKYANCTAKEVAICDAGYAAWAAANLKSDFWRKEFAQAIKDAKSATVPEVIAAQVGDDAPESAKRMVAEDYAAQKAADAMTQEILSRYASFFGVSPKALAQKAQLFVSGRAELSRNQFSSQEKFEKFSELVAELQEVPVVGF